MATRTTTTVMSHTSDATFRATGKWFSECFSTFGWTLITQTFTAGTDWNTATWTGTAQQVRVSEIWAMADAAQGSAPLYAKLQYGATSTANCFGVRFQMGTGHDGAGNLTGVMHDSGVNFIGQSATNANAMTHYASGDAGRIWICLAVLGTSWSQTNVFCLSLERRRDSSGVAQATGFLMNRCQGASVVTLGFLATSVAPMAGNAYYFPCILSAASNAILDNKIGVYPHLYPLGPSEMGLQCVGVTIANYPAGTSFTCTVLGSSHTYLATQIAGGITTGLAGGNFLCPAFLYE